MGKKKGGQKTPSFGFAADARGKGKKLDSYEDTIEPGTVDDFMFKRDQIMFNPPNESDEDEIDDGGEEIMAIPSRRRRDEVDAEEDGQELEDEDEDDAAPVKKARKEKVKADLSGKGRFGKAAIDSDDSDADADSDAGSGSGSGSSSEEEEGWGRQYYAMPSSRRARQDEGDEYDEQREQDRELEEREVRRLQRKAREALTAEDFGLEDDDQIPAAQGTTQAEEEEEDKVAVPLPQSTDPAVLLRHMETHDPVKLALAREWPLVVHKLEKTQRGMRKVEAQTEGQLHKGLGWLHYQTLVTYASTLAFYIHLAALPPAARPDLSSHPILARLLQLKKGLSDLENLDFDAASDDGENPLMPNGWADSDEEDEDEEDEDMDEEEKELRELVRNKKALIARMQNGQDEEGDEDEWMKEGMDEDELAELLADAEAEEATAAKGAKKAKKGKKDEVKERKGKKDKKKNKKLREEEEEEDDDLDFDGLDYDSILAGLKNVPAGSDDEDADELPKKKKSKKDKGNKDKTADIAAAAPAFQPLAEPDFFSSKASGSSSRGTKRPRVADGDSYETSGDPTALLDADAADKEQRKRSLAFHTAKIASTAARRAAARERRMGGDEDVPYRDRQAARDAALRKNNRGANGAGEDLDGREASESDLRKAREIRGDFDMDGDADDFDPDSAAGDAEAEGYYDLVKRARNSSKAAKQAAHDAEMEERLASRIGAEQFEGDDAEGGPRSLTRAIEKNRGLTQRRAKSGRNPRVKKRQAYEKAKQKVGSQRAVFKGGQASLGGRYAGEKTGISTVIKSAKF